MSSSQNNILQDADAEVAALKERYVKVKEVADKWVKKVDTLVKEWQLLDNTVTELNAWVAKVKLFNRHNNEDCQSFNASTCSF